MENDDDFRDEFNSIYRIERDDLCATTFSHNEVQSSLDLRSNASPILNYLPPLLRTHSKKFDASISARMTTCGDNGYNGDNLTQNIGQN